MGYAELQVSSGFSFLHGASHPGELVVAAKLLGLSAIGIADRNTVAGVVRAHAAAQETGMRLLVGSRLVFRDGTPDVLCYPTDRTAWGRLTRLLTLGKDRTEKGDCLLDRADLLAHAAGQLLIVVPPARIDRRFAEGLDALGAACRRQCHVAATRRFDGHDGARIGAIAELAAVCRTPMVATNDVLYHVPGRRALQDVLTAIRLRCSVAEAGRALLPNAERHLKPPEEMARLFGRHPQAIAESEAIAARCGFSLDQLSYEYPDEPVPEGETPDSHLKTVVYRGAASRYPQGIPDRIRDGIEKELALIASLDYARYFLTVADIVQFARSKGILCQGRGSAANSTICYCLGVTAVDPGKVALLFDRFLSTERREPPDIDIDFEHERREDVIQYVYHRYGRDRAAIAATVIHYRPKMAIREVGRALGLDADATAALSSQSWNADDGLWSDGHVRQAGLDPDSPVVRQTIALATELIGFPRHLSQHVGGFVLTRGRLDETVPIGPAAMAGRRFIEWDKDDIDRLRIMKVDVLALGMLTCVRKAFALLGIDDLAAVPQDDPATYRMLRRGDSLGVFQVESRAQMNMLPRLAPKEFYDLVIEVAIVRPGPIQGDMVHPYLRRRQGQEKVDLPARKGGDNSELRAVLGRTMGVPLFQEQAMSLAIVAAGFSSEEANWLRRAMATFRNVGTINTFRDKMVEGMVTRGYERDFAERCFRQIEGFGTYGFPESHAASFALLVYVSAWLKCHHPATFACALLNAQPMGFYSPAQIVRDAREHGVRVLEAEVNASGWDSALESGALRLGLNRITGWREDWAGQLVAARGSGFADFAALLRAGLPRAALEKLADADAMRSLGLDRRAALWRVRGLDEAPAAPLLADLPLRGTQAELPLMQPGEHVIADYQATGLSLKAHPMTFLRSVLAREGVLTCAELAKRRDGAAIRVAGVVLVRQRPGSAKGTVFATIEDETGIANIVVWPTLLARFRREVLAASLLLVEGRLQRWSPGPAADGTPPVEAAGRVVMHVMAERLHDRTAMLRRVTSGSTALPLARADEWPGAQARSPGHPRDERPLQRSRDFH